MAASPICKGDLLTAGLAETFGKNRPGDVSRASAFAAATHSDRRFASVFVTAADGLRLHVRSYGSRVASALPVVCIPGLSRTAADRPPAAGHMELGTAQLLGSPGHDPELLCSRTFVR